MPTKKKILTEIEAVLEQLLSTAEGLHEMSLKVFTQAELDKLQKTQQTLLAHLEALNASLKKLPENKKEEETALHNTIQAKLERFQKINKKFVDNLARSHHVIGLKPDR